MTMRSEIRQQVQARITDLTARRDKITCDADTHISDPATLPPNHLERQSESPNYFHGRSLSAEMLIREMDLAGVDLSLCWQNPAATPYQTDRDENARRLLAANRYIANAAARYPTRIFPTGWTDPAALGLERALKLVDICTGDLGMAVIKLNPAQNAFPIDSDDVLALVDRIVERGAVPAFHFGADTEFTPAAGLETVAKRHPDHPILAVHFGGGGAGYVEAEALYHDARDLGLRQTNIHYVQSAKRETHIESDLITYRLAGTEAARRIFLGSDAPYGRQSWNFCGYRAIFNSLAAGGDGSDPRHGEAAALFDAATVQGFMGRNFADFAAEACTRLLDANPIAR